MKLKPFPIFAILLSSTLAAPAQNRGQGAGRGGGGGMPPEFQELIHQLFANPDKIHRYVEITPDGYRAETTTDDKELVEALQNHVEQMSGRLEGGRRVRRWDPAFEEFFEHYGDMEHGFTKLENGIRAEVTGKTKKAIAAAQNHASVVFDFSSRGGVEMHQPHRAVLQEDGGEGRRFHGGPRAARAAELSKTFAARAGEAADDLVKGLGSQLKAALEAGGPVAALPVCHAVAIPVTEGVSDRFEGLTVRRVTDKPRNSDNAIDDLDRSVFERFRRAPETGRPVAHLVTEADGKGVRYYRPLVVGEVCLKCHGDKASMAPELRATIEERYPKDKAHGYETGELRGFIRVDSAVEDK